MHTLKIGDAVMLWGSLAAKKIMETVCLALCCLLGSIEGRDTSKRAVSAGDLVTQTLLANHTKHLSSEGQSSSKATFST